MKKNDDSQKKVGFISKDVASRTVNGEEIILDMAAGTYYGLNEVGTRIWNLLKEKKDLDSVSSILLKEYEVSPEILKKDVLKLANELKKLELLNC